MQAAVKKLAAADNFDLLVVIGAPSKKSGGQLAKVHCHCNEPTKIFQTSKELSTTEGIVNAKAVVSGLFRGKVEDMKQQAADVVILASGEACLRKGQVHLGDRLQRRLEITRE